MHNNCHQKQQHAQPVEVIRLQMNRFTMLKSMSLAKPILKVG